MRITFFEHVTPDGTTMLTIGGSQKELGTRSIGALETLDEWLRIAYEQGRSDAKADLREALGFR